MSHLIISKQIARRFVLGRQGLWPGRRWRGKQGTARALRACEAVQLDPLVVAEVLHDDAIAADPYEVALDGRQHAPQRRSPW